MGQLTWQEELERVASAIGSELEDIDDLVNLDGDRIEDQYAILLPTLDLKVKIGRRGPSEAIIMQQVVEVSEGHRNLIERLPNNQLQELWFAIQLVYLSGSFFFQVIRDDEEGRLFWAGTTLVWNEETQNLYNTLVKLGSCGRLAIGQFNKMIRRFEKRGSTGSDFIA